MKINEFKSVVSDFLRKMLDNWFPDKPFVKGLGISLIDANINKFDSLIKYFENENGDIDVVGLIKNMDLDKPIEIDLTKYSPIFPNRILLITKEDLDGLLRDVNQRETGEV